MSSFIWVVDGCPVAFGSASCRYADFSEITSADDGFPSNRPEDGRPGISAASLALTGWSWQESALEVLESDTVVGSMSVVLLDRPMVIEGVSRTRGVTYLGTRRATRGSNAIPNSQLSTSIDASDGTFDVDAPSLFSGFSGGAVYIDNEAIKCSSLVGSTFAVASAPDGRGAFNSVAASHTVDDANGWRPRVWWGFPGFDRRRCNLWQISNTAVATRLWGGYCSSFDRYGTGYQMTCESVLVTERARPAGLPAATPRLRGYNTKGVNASLSWSGGPTVGVRTATLTRDPADGRVVNSLAELCDEIASHMRRVLAARSVTAPYVTVTPDRGSLRMFASINSTNQLTGELELLDQHATATSVETVDPHTVTVAVRPVPSVIVIANDRADAQVPISSRENLPASWAEIDVTADAGYHTTLRPVLRGLLDDTTAVVIEPTSVADTAGSSTTNPGAIVTGRVRTETLQGVGVGLGLTTTRAATLQTQVRVRSDHWLLALRRGFVGDGSTSAAELVKSGADARDWDWSQQASLIRATQGPHARMGLYLDGATTIDGTFRDRFKTDACAIGIRQGRLSPFAFRAPLPNDPVVLTVTKAMLGGRPPEWKRLRNALVNIVEIDVGHGLTILVRDQQSAERFGPSRKVQVRLVGSNDLALGDDESPFAIVGRILSRQIGLFGTPVSAVSFTLGPSHIDAAALGDFVKISEWLSPDGNGAIGLTDTVGQVVVRAPNNVGGRGEGSVTFTLLLYGLDGLSGFAPAIRASTLTTTNVARDTIGIATAYLSSAASDYAGSNLASYRGTANDGGQYFIAAGQKFRLVERDSTTPRTPESVTVLSVGGGKVIFTAGVNVAWAAIAAAGNLDIVPDTYSTSVTAQRLYCYAASDTAPYPIGGTADLAKVFAP